MDWVLDSQRAHWYFGGSSKVENGEDLAKLWERQSEIEYLVMFVLVPKMSIKIPSKSVTAAVAISIVHK